MPILEPLSFHQVRIAPGLSCAESPKMRYRLQGTDDWTNADDLKLTVKFKDQIYEAQLYYEITELSVTIESPIVTIKEHWKELSSYLRIDMEELALKRTVSVNFGEQFLGNAIYTASIERIGDTKEIIPLRSFASTLLYSNTSLRPGEEYVFKFQVTSLNRPRTSDYVAITTKFVVPADHDHSSAEAKEAWTDLFGKTPVEYDYYRVISNSYATWSFNTASKGAKLQFYPHGWYVYETKVEDKTTTKRSIAGSYHIHSFGSDSFNVLMCPLIKDKYVLRKPLVLEGENSDAHNALLITDVVLEIAKYLPELKDLRLVCKCWFEVFPLTMSAVIKLNECHVSHWSKVTTMLSRK